jgi:hypothetical protein
MTFKYFYDLKQSAKWYLYNAKSQMLEQQCD